MCVLAKQTRLSSPTSVPAGPQRPSVDLLARTARAGRVMSTIEHRRICPTPDKISYRSRDAAIKNAVRMARRFTTAGRPYRCSVVDGTSPSPKNSGRARMSHKGKRTKAHTLYEIALLWPYDNPPTLPAGSTTARWTTCCGSLTGGLRVRCGRPAWVRLTLCSAARRPQTPVRRGLMTG